MYVSVPQECNTYGGQKKLSSPLELELCSYGGKVPNLGILQQVTPETSKTYVILLVFPVLLLLLLIICLLVFETGYLYVAVAILDLAMQTWLLTNFQISACFCLQNAGIKSFHVPPSVDKCVIQDDLEF